MPQATGWGCTNCFIGFSILLLPFRAWWNTPTNTHRSVSCLLRNVIIPGLGVVAPPSFFSSRSARALKVIILMLVVGYFLPCSPAASSARIRKKWHQWQPSTTLSGFCRAATTMLFIHDFFSYLSSGEGKVLVSICVVY